MKKMMFRAPVQTASGYGVHSRMLLKSFEKSGLFDITVMSVPWGATPLIYEHTPEMDHIVGLSNKFNPGLSPDDFDVSIQVTIPNEFTRLARMNIGITAGIETDRVAAMWLQKVNTQVDLLVVPSRHSYDAFRHTVHRVSDQEQANRLGVPRGTELKLQKPMYLLPEWADPEHYNCNLSDGGRFKDEFPSAFNFIAVGLGLDKADGEDRKNLALLVRWFCEQFKGNPDVGLVLKVSMVGYSPIDFKNTRNRIQYIKNQTGCGPFPRIHLIHGRLSDSEMAALYKHPKVKAMVSLAHGEGFGLPIIEAAACGLPVIATNWSGQLDFLQDRAGKRLFVPVDYTLNEIPPSNIWTDVMDAGSKYAFPIEADAKLKMAKVVLSYERPKQWAHELACSIPERFNEGLGLQFARKLNDALDGKNVQIDPVPFYPVAPYAGDPAVFDKITLVCVSSVLLNGSVSALLRTMEQLPFKRAKFFTHADFSDPVLLDPRIEVVKIAPITNISLYNQFVVRSLAGYIDTEFVMIVQQDGFALNGSAWTNEFLQHDYIGAPWFWDKVVGNGAFNIRSKRLMDELVKPEYSDIEPEDDKICRKYGEQLRAKGFTFAPAALADKFSIENQGLDLQGKYRGQLGWHGRTPYYGAWVPN